MAINLLLPLPLPLLCGVDVSYDTPPFSPVLRFLPGQSLSDKSFLMLSNHLRVGLPLLLFPGTSIPSLSCLRIHFLFSIHAHFNLLSALSLAISPTFVVPLIISFLILSSLVTPLIHLNILISATSNLFYCAFFTALVSAPYIIAGLTTVLYTFPLTLTRILRSNRIPDTLFQFFHPDCILCVVFVSKSLPMSFLDIQMYSLFPMAINSYINNIITIIVTSVALTSSGRPTHI